MILIYFIVLIFVLLELYLIGYRYYMINYESSNKMTMKNIRDERGRLLARFAINNHVKIVDTAGKFSGDHGVIKSIEFRFDPEKIIYWVHTNRSEHLLLFYEAELELI